MNDRPLPTPTTIPTVIGCGQGTATSPYQFTRDRHTAQFDNTQALDTRDPAAHHDYTSSSVIGSDSDSLTDDTSTTTVPSLDTEQIELLQLEHDLLSLDSSYIGEPDDWDTEVAYNKLNYLIAPDTSAPSSVNHDTSDNQVNHTPGLDRTDQNLAIRHNIHNVIHDSNGHDGYGTQLDKHLTFPGLAVRCSNETTTEVFPDVILLGDIRHSSSSSGDSSTHDNNNLKSQDNNKEKEREKESTIVIANSELEFNEMLYNTNKSHNTGKINIVSQNEKQKHDNSNSRS